MKNGLGKGVVSGPNLEECCLERVQVDFENIGGWGKVGEHFGWSCRRVND